jgi:hypothetical protein
MKDTEGTARSDAPATLGAASAPRYRPLERFWPYVELTEHPSDEELAALNPELAAALFGTPPRPFSLTLSFAPFEGPEYPRAIELARASLEYQEIGSGPALRHVARFRSEQVSQIRALWDLIGRLDSSEVLLDDQPVPYAKELWLPLLWLLDL